MEEEEEKKWGTSQESWLWSSIFLFYFPFLIIQQSRTEWSVKSADMISVMIWWDRPTSIKSVDQSSRLEAVPITAFSVCISSSCSKANCLSSTIVKYELFHGLPLYHQNEIFDNRDRPNCLLRIVCFCEILQGTTSWWTTVLLNWPMSHVKSIKSTFRLLVRLIILWLFNHSTFQLSIFNSVNRFLTFRRIDVNCTDRKCSFIAMFWGSLRRSFVLSRLVFFVLHYYFIIFFLSSDFEFVQTILASSRLRSLFRYCSFSHYGSHFSVAKAQCSALNCSEWNPANWNRIVIQIIPNLLKWSSRTAVELPDSGVMNFFFFFFL